MPPTWLILTALIVWTVLAVGAGVLVGKGIRYGHRRDRAHSISVGVRQPGPGRWR